MEKMMNFTLNFISQEGFFKEKRMCREAPETKEVSQAPEAAEGTNTAINIQTLSDTIEQKQQDLIAQVTGTDRASAEIRQALEVRFAALKAEADQLETSQQQDKQQVAQEIRAELERLTGQLTIQKTKEVVDPTPRTLQWTELNPQAKEAIYSQVPSYIQQCFALLDNSKINWPGIGFSNDFSPEETQIKQKLVEVAQIPEVKAFINDGAQNPFLEIIQEYIKKTETRSRGQDNDVFKKSVQRLIASLEEEAQKIKKEHPIVESTKKETPLATTTVEVPAPTTPVVAEPGQVAQPEKQPTYEENWAKATVPGEQATPSSAKVTVKTSLNVRDDNGARKAGHGLKNDTVVTIMEGAKKMVEGYEAGATESKARKFVKIQYEQDGKTQEGWVAEDYLIRITEEESKKLAQNTIENLETEPKKDAIETLVPLPTQGQDREAVLPAMSENTPSATRSVSEITLRQFEEAIRKMPNEIRLPAPRTNNPAMIMDVAASNLRAEIQKNIMQAFGVTNSAAQNAVEMSWALGKVNAIDRDQVARGATIQISPDEKRTLLQDFIRANQQSIQRDNTSIKSAPTQDRSPRNFHMGLSGRFSDNRL